MERPAATAGRCSGRGGRGRGRRCGRRRRHRRGVVRSVPATRSAPAWASVRTWVAASTVGATVSAGDSDGAVEADSDGDGQTTGVASGSTRRADRTWRADRTRRTGPRMAWGMARRSRAAARERAPGLAVRREPAVVEVARPRALRAAPDPGPRSARASQPASAAIHASWSFSNPATCSTAIAARPGPRAGLAVGAVPGRNSSLTDWPPPWPTRPVQGSTAACSSPSGCLNPLMLQPFVASCRKPCQT